MCDCVSDKKTITLVDPSTDSVPAFREAFTVVAVSPGSVNLFRDFKKRGLTYWMPAWEKCEVAAAGVHVMGSGYDKWRNRYYTQGGVLRYMWCAGELETTFDRYVSENSKDIR